MLMNFGIAYDRLLGTLEYFCVSKVEKSSSAGASRSIFHGVEDA